MRYKEMKNFEEAMAQLRNEENRIQAIKAVYEKVLDDMHWDCMTRAKNEDNEVIYDEDGLPVWIEMDEDDYWYNPFKKLVYEQVLAYLEETLTR